MSAKKVNKKDKQAESIIEDQKVKKKNKAVIQSESGEKLGKKGKKNKEPNANENDVENKNGQQVNIPAKQRKKRAKADCVIKTETPVLSERPVKVSRKKKTIEIKKEIPENGIDSNENININKKIKKEIPDPIPYDDSSDSDAESKEKKVEIEKEDKKRAEISWPEEDLLELIENMEKLIPENDNMAFTTRTEKLEWDKVTFKEYSVEECKKTWSLTVKKIRKYRLLQEVLSDAKEIIKNPVNSVKKKRAHPDMPKRPLSSYLLFYLKKKDKVIAENPGVELTEISKKIGLMYKTLPPEKKAKYDKLAAKAKEEYEEKMKDFYHIHPEFLVKPTPPPKPVKERIPKKPTTPFGFFFQSELNKENIPESEKTQFKEVCKERWKQMSDKKKLFWIDWAEQQQIVYEQAMKTYQANHPDYVVNHGTKGLLTKEEKCIKERVAGKPSKPPNSAYSLFARIVLQSEDVKGIPTKERLNFVSARWKCTSEEEKNSYREMQTNMMDKYKIDFASYLDSLPEDKRNLEILNNAPKRKRSVDSPSKPKKKRKKSSSSSRSRKPKAKEPVEKKPAKFTEPEQPPRSAFKYFVTQYAGTEPVGQVWKKLSSEEKEKYEEELIKKKQEYIVSFEKFLKSLTKEELEAFSNSRKQQQQMKQEQMSEDEEEDESEDEDSDDNESSDNSDGNADEYEEDGE